MFISTCFRAKTSISKGEFIKSVLKRVFFEFFTTIIPYFSHTYLSFSLINPSYRRVVVRVILGDQSVVITKVFIFVFEEADLRVRIVLGSSENSV